MLSRRRLLGGLGLGLAGLATSNLLSLGESLANGSQTSPRFIFILNRGGWDPTTVFAPKFGLESIDMEADATLGTTGNISFVDHASRPSVRLFLERNYQQTAIINGVNIPSLSHDVCAKLALTGHSNGDYSDWATLVAQSSEAAFSLPHLVFSGLSYPGPLGAIVSQVGENGQLAGLLSGQIVDPSDLPAGRPNPLQERLLDDYLTRRAQAVANKQVPSGVEQMGTEFQRANSRAQALKGDQFSMDFSPDPSLINQCRAAIDSLSLGISRCVTVATNTLLWDTHQDNSAQSGNFETLFAALIDLSDELANTPGPEGQPLSSDTIVVVLSEMGRTPRLNAVGGKDHWPHSSMLWFGPKITGNRVVGAFDDNYYGMGVNPGTGELDSMSPVLHPSNLGATLLAMADIDPSSLFPGYPPISGMLL